MSDRATLNLTVARAPAVAQVEALAEVVHRLGDVYVIKLEVERRQVVSVLLTDEDVVDDLAARFGAAPAPQHCSCSWPTYERHAELVVSDHADGVTRSWQVRLVTSRSITARCTCAPAADSVGVR